MCDGAAMSDSGIVDLCGGFRKRGSENAFTEEALSILMGRSDRIVC
jgi:hypothetical protein